MIDKIKELFKKYRELILYVFFGGLTTLVDFAVYFVFTRFIDIGEIPANCVAVAAAIVFAYIVNKQYVFNDKRKTLSAVLIQFASFASMRVISGALQTLSLWVFSTILGLYDMAVKLVTAVVVVLLNYIFSKLIIFRKKETNKN